MTTRIDVTAKNSLPDHTQLPDSDGTFVKNFQQHPPSILLTQSLICLDLSKTFSSSILL